MVELVQPDSDISVGIQMEEGLMEEEVHCGDWSSDVLVFYLRNLGSRPRIIKK